MQRISEKSAIFIKENVPNLDDYLPLNDDSIIDLMHKIEELYVIPLSNAEAEGEAIDSSLLLQADRVVDELNVGDFDFDYFNKIIYSK